METQRYRLACLQCGRRFEDLADGMLLSCDGRHPPALLRAEYAEERLPVDPQAPGLFRWAGWLPVRRTIPGAAGPVVFRSERFSGRLGLEDLWLAFTGWWPERGARAETCSFKELEACAVLARLPAGFGRSLVVASAGNTGRAFLQMASRLDVPVVVVVPRTALPMLWLTVERSPRARLVAVEGDYADAIEFAGRIATRGDCAAEGGARNVARRDGMGTVLLAAVEAIGGLPRHYVQAVGSGTGAIAAAEMAGRLRGRAASGTADLPMQLHLVQAEPFAPMRNAWRAGSRELPAISPEEARRLIGKLHAPVLGNRAPPWGIVGGLYDTLRESGGSVEAVDSAEARRAGALFEECEGQDLDPAAEVALAGLAKAVERGAIARGDRVLMNLTGGGARRLAAGGGVRAAIPDLVTGRGPEGLAAVEGLLRRDPLVASTRGAT